MPNVSEVYSRGMTELHRATLSYDETVRFSVPEQGFVVETQGGSALVECGGVQQEVEAGKLWKFADLGTTSAEVKLRMGTGTPEVLFTW